MSRFRFTARRIAAVVAAILTTPIKPPTLRLPRLRFTVRGLMIAVAIAATTLGAGLWGLRLSRLSAHYQARAEDLDRMAHRVTRGSYIDGKGGAYHVEWPEPHPQHYLSLKAKYERAARYPWLPIAPDPPKPE